MKYSQLFGKTSKSPLKDSKFVSHQLLTKGGFIAESAAGRYYLLPLGWRVHDKIKAIIKKEMDAHGAQEMISPTLHPLELWEETNRTQTVGFELMTIADRRGARFALGGTAEEMFVDLVRKFPLSYRDLPFNLYQFSTKFRDELRARGGLLRVREFMMKDAYSFDVDQEAFRLTYQAMEKAYTQIFNHCGLTTKVVAADNGYIGGEFCHEFQVECPSGEGQFFESEDGHYAAHLDVAANYHPPINLEDEQLPLETITQPAWVKTIEDNQKHYQRPAHFFLKNVVYRSSVGDLFIVVIRGDLDVNQVKLEKVLGLSGQLEEATVADLALLGTKPGYVQSWGHQFLTETPTEDQTRARRLTYLADLSLKTVHNFIGGQKTEQSDSRHVNYGRDFKHELEADLAVAVAGAPGPDGKSPLRLKHGIEVGNIFQLGTHYTSRMAGAVFTNREGKPEPFYMGCYGIGLGRTLAAIVELHHDEHGIIWPETVAPYRYHLISLPGGEEQAARLYQALLAAHQEVLWDERPLGAGQKFADADLLGCPYRLVCSAKTGEQLELKRRGEAEAQLLDQTAFLRSL